MNLCVVVVPTYLSLPLIDARIDEEDRKNDVDPQVDTYMYISTCKLTESPYHEGKR